MTWDIFLRLREWAKGAARKHHARVYLVGSVLEKAEPRDIDLAIVLPVHRIEKRFGPAPKPGTEEMQEYMGQLHAFIVDDYIAAQIAVPERSIDVRFCPQDWWEQKDRLLLAEG